jgi:hypothetical protein
VMEPFVQFCQSPTLSTRHQEDEIPAGLEAVNVNTAVLELVGLEGVWVSATLGVPVGLGVVVVADVSAVVFCLGFAQAMSPTAVSPVATSRLKIMTR